MVLCNTSTCGPAQTALQQSAVWITAVSHQAARQDEPHRQPLYCSYRRTTVCPAASCSAPPCRAATCRTATYHAVQAARATAVLQQALHGSIPCSSYSRNRVCFASSCCTATSYPSACHTSTCCLPYVQFLCVYLHFGMATCGSWPVSYPRLYIYTSAHPQPILPCQRYLKCLPNQID